MDFVEFIKNFKNEHQEEINELPEYNHPFLKDESEKPLKWKLPDDDSHEALSEIPVFKKLMDGFMEEFFYTKEIKVNLKDHCRFYGEKALHEFNETKEDGYSPLSYESIKKYRIPYVVKALANMLLTPDRDMFLHLDSEMMLIAEDLYCEDCGERLRLEYDLLESRIAPLENEYLTIPKCPCAGEDFLIKATIPVPSGKLVFANNLRCLFTEKEVETIEDISVNSFYGRKKHTLDYAKLGMLFASVGNTSPNVYSVNEGEEILVGNFWEEMEEENNLPENAVPVGNICTDLWWYCAIDFDDFKRRLKVFEESGEEKNPSLEDYFVVEIKGTEAHLEHYVEIDEDVDVFSKIIIK